MKPITTPRLLIRALQRSDYAPYAELMRVCFYPDYPEDDQQAIVDYMIAGERGRGLLRQPPYGDRAVILQDSGELIGSVGLVPSMVPDGKGLLHPQMGMFWAMHPEHRRHGYTREAAAALMEFAFQEVGVWRLVATTEAENVASQGVMVSLGMRLEHYSHVPWWQVLGVKDNPREGRRK
jgi:[ribosomal protein S5]-alanine N-acetyltransferase